MLQRTGILFLDARGIEESDVKKRVAVFTQPVQIIYHGLLGWRNHKSGIVYEISQVYDPLA
jgi:hypothetical protein